MTFDYVGTSQRNLLRKGTRREIESEKLMSTFGLIDSACKFSSKLLLLLGKSMSRFRRQFIMEMEMWNTVVKVIVIRHKVHSLMVGEYQSCQHDDQV